MRTWFKDLFNLEFIPRGLLTKIGGWTGIAAAAVCLFHGAIPGVPCPSDPLLYIVAGLTGVGLGRRGSV